jgi:hypothetical protein
VVYNTLSRAKGQELYEAWIRDGRNLSILNSEYEEIRQNISKMYQEAKKSAEKNERNGASDYVTDVYFAASLYEYLNSIGWFSMHAASNPDFWRYLAIVVSPDVVYDRWGDSPGHFYSKAVRNYFQSMWWYIHLSWQGNVEDTVKTLLYPGFDSDTVLNLTERPGSNGAYVEVFRYIMKYFSLLDTSVLRAYSGKGRTTLFRSLMKLHTAKSVVIDPLLYEGGASGYARNLFSEVGIKRNMAPKLYSGQEM